MQHTSSLTSPVFLMSYPLTLATTVPNNPYMQAREHREIDHPRASRQFELLYQYLAREAVVYLLPPEGDFQDRPYVANLGCYLPHLTDRNVILLANFRSSPRIGEEKAACKFFHALDYEVYQPECFWEGEADLKHLRDNIYLGGYGIRSEATAHDWMEDNFEMDVLSIPMNDSWLFHLDCLIFVMGPECLLVGTQALRGSTVRELEKRAELVDVPARFLYSGITNCLKLHDQVLCARPVNSNSRSFLEKVCLKRDLEPVFFDLREFDKSGADLSSLIMHLNR
jgi:N-dimethylarginine dimethylaminohydrolase